MGPLANAFDREKPKSGTIGFSGRESDNLTFLRRTHADRLSCAYSGCAFASLATTASGSASSIFAVIETPSTSIDGIGLLVLTPRLRIRSPMERAFPLPDENLFIAS